MDLSPKELSRIPALIHKIGWGDLQPAPHIKVGWGVEQAVEGAPTLFVEVKVQEYEIRSPLFQGHVVKRPPAKQICRSEIDTDRMQSFKPKIKNMVGLLSLSLREHDPRIGTILPDGDVVRLLPRSPLFDPARMRPPLWKGGAGMDSTPCPFCQEGFGRGYPAMWGGGNIFWVHPSCWLDHNLL